MAHEEPNKASSSLKLPFKVRFLLAAHTAAVNASKLLNGTVRQQFIDFMDTKVPPSPTTPIKGVTSTDFIVSQPRNLWFRLYNPSTTTKLPTVIFFHGGGFVYFSADSKPFDELCKLLARELPAVVISVNYRLAPAYKFPSQYDDGFDALKFIDSTDFQPPENMDLKHVFLSGDSAGGNLAHHVTVRAGQGQHMFREVKIAGLVLLMPFFGGEERTESEKRLTNVPLINVETTDWMWKSFLPEGATRNHAAVNVFGAEGADISALPWPSTAVFVAGFDPLQDWQRRYVEWLKESGKDAVVFEYTTAFHGCYTFSEIKENVKIIEDFREFIKKQMTAVDEAPSGDTTAREQVQEEK